MEWWIIFTKEPAENELWFKASEATKNFCGEILIEAIELFFHIG